MSGSGSAATGAPAAIANSHNAHSRFSRGRTHDELVARLETELRRCEELADQLESRDTDVSALRRHTSELETQNEELRKVGNEREKKFRDWIAVLLPLAKKSPRKGKEKVLQLPADIAEVAIDENLEGDIYDYIDALEDQNISFGDEIKQLRKEVAKLKVDLDKEMRHSKNQRGQGMKQKSTVGPSKDIRQGNEDSQVAGGKKFAALMPQASASQPQASQVEQQSSEQTSENAGNATANAAGTPAQPGTMPTGNAGTLPLEKEPTPEVDVGNSAVNELGPVSDWDGNPTATNPSASSDIDTSSTADPPSPKDGSDISQEASEQTIVADGVDCYTVWILARLTSKLVSLFIITWLQKAQDKRPDIQVIERLEKACGCIARVQQRLREAPRIDLKSLVEKENETYNKDIHKLDIDFPPIWLPERENIEFDKRTNSWLLFDVLEGLTTQDIPVKDNANSKWSISHPDFFPLDKVEADWKGPIKFTLKPKKDYSSSK